MTGEEFETTFWNGLTKAKESGMCPECAEAGLEVRKAKGRRGPTLYVRHCGTIRRALTGGAAVAFGAMITEGA